MKREEALILLKEHVKTDRVLRHSLAVEAAMRAYAKKFGEDDNYWGLLGLLHDIDFEKYPDEHPYHAPELLKPAGFDETFITTILSHASASEFPRDTKEKLCLHAVDEMASFIIAVALVNKRCQAPFVYFNFYLANFLYTSIPPIISKIIKIYGKILVANNILFKVL